jgi:protein ImuB
MFGGLFAPRPLASPEALAQLGRAFTPRVEVRSPTLVLLDLSGFGRTFEGPEALGRALLEAARERQLEVSVALAYTRTAVCMLARARPGLTLVPAGGEAAALAPLPLELLDVEEDLLALFHRWGLRRLGDLAALPPRGLAERLGPEGPRLRRRARGEDEEPLVPSPPAESFHSRLELDWAVDGLEPLAFLLSRLLEPLVLALHARGRKAQALTLELTLADGRPHRRTLRVASPTGDARTWRTLLLLDLEARPPGDAVTALAVTAEPTPAREVQFSLLDPAQPSPERLAETMARLAALTAAGRCGAASLLDSHRPGAFVLRTFAPGPFLPPKLAPGAAPTPPPSPRAALRAFRPPLRAEVSLARGAPTFVSAPGLRGTVADRAGPWRASGDWWDAAWAREEWDVLVGGRLLRLVRDRLNEEWIIDGEID